MAVSDVAICNSALAKIGAERILSLSDDNPRALVMSEQFPKVRDNLLYSHPWKFAIKQQELALLSTTPLIKFTYQFQLPNDCLRVIGTDLPGAAEWQEEGRVILCNFSTLKVRFISNSTDYANYTPGFVEALAAVLAADVCYSLVQNAALKSELVKESEMKVRQARSFNAQESGGDRVYADTWLTSRY